MARIKFDDIKLEAENNNWKLLSESYKNLETEMEWKCPEGHNVFVSLKKWRRKHECPICETNPFIKSEDTTVIKKAKNVNRILAFDQASITSGWAIFDDQRLVKYGTHTSKGKTHFEKVAKTKFWIASMIESWQPDFVVLEDIQLQKLSAGGTESVVTYKKLAALLGVLSNYLFEKNLKFEIIPSATWRSANSIKGKSRTDRKKNAQLKIKEWYDVSVTNDEADAICLGRHMAEKQSRNQVISFI